MTVELAAWVTGLVFCVTILVLSVFSMIIYWLYFRVEEAERHPLVKFFFDALVDKEEKK